MIKLENISKSFGKQLVLDDINLHIKAGEKVLIMGQNGAGKSTLMKVILAQVIVDSGSVLISGLNPFKQRKKALANLAFVPQTPPPLKLTVSELCEYAMSLGDFELSAIKNALNSLEFDYEREQTKLFTTLSGGMKQKLLIALSLSKNSPVVLFDEPTANLDPKAREQFLSLLAKNSQNKTLLFISHRIDEVQSLVNRVIEMDLGKIIKDKKMALKDVNSLKNSKNLTLKSTKNSQNLNDSKALQNASLKGVKSTKNSQNSRDLKDTKNSKNSALKNENSKTLKTSKTPRKSPKDKQ